MNKSKPTTLKMSSEDIIKKDIEHLIKFQQLDDQYLSDILNADHETAAGNIEIFRQNLSTYARQMMKLIDEMNKFYLEFGMITGFAIHCKDNDSTFIYMWYNRSLEILSKKIRTCRYRLAINALNLKFGKGEEQKTAHTVLEKFLNERLCIPELAKLPGPLVKYKTKKN